MRELFINFVQSPDRDSYFAIREAVRASEHYQPYSADLREVFKLMNEDRLHEARELLAVSMPNLLLSPAAHWIGAQLAEKAQDVNRAAMEQFVAAICCEGIRSTGEGTQETPYVVLHPSDEHDLLHYLGKEPQSQSLIVDGDRHLDCIECTDGSTLWFDITDAFRMLDDMVDDRA